MSFYDKYIELLTQKAQKVKDLKDQIRVNNNKIIELNDDYEKAVLAGDDKKADSIHKKQRDLRDETENCSKKLELFSGDRVLHEGEIADVSAQALVELKKEVKKAEKKQQDKLKDLESIKKEYLAKVAEIGEATREIRSNHLKINKILQDTKRTAFEGYHPKLGYMPLNKTIEQNYNELNLGIKDEQLLFEAISGRGE